MDEARAEGVDGVRRRPPKGFGGITWPTRAWWSTIGE